MGLCLAAESVTPLKKQCAPKTLCSPSPTDHEETLKQCSHDAGPPASEESLSQGAHPLVWWYCAEEQQGAMGTLTLR